MMKSAKTIVDKAMYTMNLVPPTTLFGNDDTKAKHLLYLLDAVCEELRREGPYRQQIQLYEFATVADTATYPLPVDFWGAIPHTYFNKDTNWRLIGPASDAQFAEYKEGQRVTPYEYIWRVLGWDENPNSTTDRQFEMYPPPAAAENQRYEFITAHLYVPATNWNASTAYTLNAYVNVNGQIYQVATAGTTGTTPPSGRSDGQTDGGVTWNHIDTPYETIKADTDLCIFDADLVALGVISKYIKNAKGEALAASATKEFEDAKVKHKFRWEGTSVARGDKAYQGSRMRPFVKPSSWSYVS